MNRRVVERSYLVRRVETWEIETDLTDEQLDAWRIGDFGAFDDAVCEGELIEETYDLIDNDDLDATIEWDVEVAR